MRFTLEFPVFTVKKMLRLNAAGNINLEPGFQRDSVWEDKNRALLIDSILQNVPLPSILLWHEKKGNKNIYHVVDGKQRIETLIAFTKPRMGFSYDQKVAIKHHGNKDWAGIYEDIAGLEVSYKLLGSKAKGLFTQFNQFPIPVVVIKDANSLEDIRELFVRVNSTGMKLNSSEVRRARFLNSKLLFEAERISSLKSVQKFFIENKVFTKSQFKRMKVVEFITELMLSIKSNDVLDKKSSIDQMMESAITDSKVKKLGQEVKSIIEYMAKYISDNDCRLKTTRFRNTADLYALAFCLWKMKNTSGMIIEDKTRSNMAFGILVDLDKQLKKHSVAFNDGKGFKSLPGVVMRYQKTIVAGTDSGPNRTTRVEIIKDLIGSAFIKKDTDRLFSADLKELLWHSTDRKCTIPDCKMNNRLIKNYKDLEIDHRFAHAKGGQTNLANAQIAHVKCNRAKGARS